MPHLIILFVTSLRLGELNTYDIFRTGFLFGEIALHNLTVSTRCGKNSYNEAFNLKYYFVRKSGCKQANRTDTRAIVEFEIDASSCMRLRILAQHLDLPSAAQAISPLLCNFF
ncbi:MAG: hypothetical protein JNM09_03815 [Blastocatellia bacterium]|nr:hypothetical protein [Blastocatellia bacterium]